jgi:hypothetical protein
LSGRLHLANTAEERIVRCFHPIGLINQPVLGQNKLTRIICDAARAATLRAGCPSQALPPVASPARISASSSLDEPEILPS